jgi:hypothetical protein
MVVRALGRYSTVVHACRVLFAVMAAVLAAVAGEHHLHMTCSRQARSGSDMAAVSLMAGGQGLGSGILK